MLEGTTNKARVSPFSSSWSVYGTFFAVDSCDVAGPAGNDDSCCCWEECCGEAGDRSCSFASPPPLIVENTDQENDLLYGSIQMRARRSFFEVVYSSDAMSYTTADPLSALAFTIFKAML
jgi:hypothetical protein